MIRINNVRLINIIHQNSDLLRAKEFKYRDIDKKIDSYEKYILSYNNIDYIFNKVIINKDFYLLYALDGNTYINILIFKKRKLAEIHTVNKIFNYFNHTNQYINSKLLLITFKFLKKYKKMLNIKYIILIDKSRFHLTDNKELIASKAHALLTGDTWFGKYGFLEYDYSNYKISNLDNGRYNANKNKFLNLTITDVNLLKYINKTNNDVLIDVAKKTLIENPKMLLKDFLKYLLINYDENADEFHKYYENIYDDNSGYNIYYRMIGLKL
jgi:hypothetical protein